MAIASYASSESLSSLKTPAPNDHTHFPSGF